MAEAIVVDWRKQTRLWDYRITYYGMSVDCSRKILRCVSACRCATIA